MARKTNLNYHPAIERIYRLRNNLRQQSREAVKAAYPVGAVVVYRPRVGRQQTLTVVAHGVGNEIRLLDETTRKSRWFDGISVLIGLEADNRDS